MADERKEASLLPIPGGDVRIIAYSFVLCVGTCGLVMAVILWLIPETERSHMVVALVTGIATSLPSWLAYLKGHANGNAAQEIKDKADEAAAKAAAAVQVAAATRQEVRINTQMTSETLDAVKQPGGAAVELHGPRVPASEGDEPGD